MSRPKICGCWKWAAAVVLLAAMLALTAGSGASNGTESYDVVIANGRVMDPESRLDAVRNVGVRGGKIVVISTAPLEGKQSIDARSLVVAPGFIDLHQHGQDAENYAAKAADGVTTALELEVGVADVDGWYSERESKALINFGASAGHIPARMAVMHDPGGLLPSGDAAHRVASPAEMDQISALIEKGLKRGALAVGLGPAYTEAATNQEILDVFRVAAKYHATCHVHIRASDSSTVGNFSGFEEVMAAAAITGAPLHIVHIQSTGGPNVTQELQMIADARSRGMDVTTESYPYTMGMTSVQAAMFDHKEEEPATYFASLLWPATGEHLTKESFLRYRKQGGMVIVPANTPENVHAAVVSPLKKMTLMPAQRLEQRAPMFKNKGRIRVGADADITVFDPNRVIDKATYEKPLQYSEGIQFVFVNGVTVVKDGRRVDGVLPGRAARAPVSQ